MSGLKKLRPWTWSMQLAKRVLVVHVGLPEPLRQNWTPKIILKKGNKFLKQFLQLWFLKSYLKCCQLQLFSIKAYFIIVGNVFVLLYLVKNSPCRVQQPSRLPGDDKVDPASQWKSVFRHYSGHFLAPWMTRVHQVKAHVFLVTFRVFKSVFEFFLLNK